MIQIDGHSRGQLERALSEGRMPHLRRLMESGGYRLHSLYSARPSCTPASQAQLFSPLAGGSSYSNLYAGGALRSSLCACQMGLGGILGDIWAP